MGIDYLLDNVQLCTNLGMPVQYGNVYDLEIEDTSVDFIFFVEVIEHLTNPQKALNEIARVLKPGGKVVIVFPNDRLIKIFRLLTMKFKEAVSNYGHVNQFTHKDLIKMLNKNGFIVVSQLSFPCALFRLHGVILGAKPMKDFEISVL